MKKKYKKWIKNWDSKTGMSTSQPEEFSSFCFNDTWEKIWIYLMDIKSDYQLYISCTKGTSLKILKGVWISQQWQRAVTNNTKTRSKEKEKSDIADEEIHALKKNWTEISDIVSYLLKTYFDNKQA